MLGFGLLNVYCRFLWFKPRFWEKCLRWIQANEVWAMRIKRSLQRGPKDPRKGKTHGPRRNTKRHQNAAHGQQNRTTTTVGTTARGGSHGQAVVELASPGCAVFLRVPLRLPAVFCFVLPLSTDVSGHSREANAPQSALFSFSIRVLE